VSDLGRAAFDHVAKLQSQLDDLQLQVGMVAVAGIALGLAVMLLSWQLWHQH
jgi:hypothetical protein